MRPLKLNRRASNHEQGNTLVLVLVMTLTIGTVLAGFLELLGSRYKITLRSQCWNAGVPLLEAGLEEALAHLQDDMNSPAANGWTLGSIGGQPVYSKQRTFEDGSYFLVNIYNGAAAASNTPTVYSTGFVPSPLKAHQYITRTARIMGTNQPLIRFAFGAVSTIQMNGNGTSADSFNSSNPALSTNGQYDSSKTSTNGNVASVYGPVDFGNHSIKGSLYLGPSASSTVNSSQVSGSINTDFNVTFPDVVLPTTSWLPATIANVGGVPTYDFTTSGDYYINSSTNIQVEAGVSVRLRVDTANFNPASVHIASTNGVFRAP